MDHFLRRLSDRRGKTITLCPAAALDVSAPCGMVVSTSLVDYVCFAANTSPLHQLHIILHEIGHLEFDHQGHRIILPPDPNSPPRCAGTVAEPGTVGSLGIVAQLLPHLDPAAIRRLFSRTAYIADDEYEAELFATLAGDRITRLMATPQPGVPRDMDVVRLQSLFDIPAQRGRGRG